MLTTAFAPNYSRATREDADEAEAKLAEARAEGARQAREREDRLYAFAEAADKLAEEMRRLTRFSAIVSTLSFLVATPASLVALLG